MLFLNPNWKDTWGGHQQYWESRDGEMIDEVAPMFNRFVMFENKKESPYHSVKKLTCPKSQVRTALRIFYYISSGNWSSMVSARSRKDALRDLFNDIIKNPGRYGPIGTVIVLMDIDEAMKVLNGIMSRDWMLKRWRGTRHYERPTQGEL